MMIGLLRFRLGPDCCFVSGSTAKIPLRVNSDGMALVLYRRCSAHSLLAVFYFNSISIKGEVASLEEEELSVSDSETITMSVGRSEPVALRNLIEELERSMSIRS